MDISSKQNGWRVALKHAVLLCALIVLTIGTYRFASEPDRYWPSRAKEEKDFMITFAPDVPSKLRHIVFDDTARILGGGLLMGFIVVGAIRVSKSWIRKSH